MLRGALAILVFVILAAAAAGTAILHRSYPSIAGESRLIGLERPAQVVRDRNGVPHIFAETEHDLFFLQGYVTAQDRLFQMDLLRRVGHGRLSEMFGPATIDSDRFLRTIGMGRVAEREVELLSAPARAALEAYAAGVNKYAADRADAPPVEFLLLGHRWEPWRPADSVVLGKVMAWDLGANWESELRRADVLARLGPEALAVLFPDTRFDNPDIVGLAPAPGSAATRSPGAAQVRALLGSLDPSGLGSNSWVLSGARTTTGAPLLANDVHLAPRNPSIWYLTRLSGPETDVAGFTIPGAPGVVIGHNGRIAWGVTNLGADVQDLYVERPDPADPTRFLYRGASEAAQIRREEIRVKGAPSHFIDVTVTRHGPILTPVLEGTRELVALRWTALEPGRLVEAVYRLDRARDWDEFSEALRDWDVPGQNFVYADVDGHIGYRTTGRIPIRSAGRGLLPVPGWTGEHEWIGLIPYDELPFLLDPPSGYVVTANHEVDAGYRHFMSDEFDPGFRAARIHQLIAARERHAAADLGAMQGDVLDLGARAHLVYLRALEPAGERSAAARRLLAGWNGEMCANSAAAALYQAWFRRMLEITFADKLGLDLYREYLGSGRIAYSALTKMAADADHPWFVVPSDPTLRGRDALAAAALERAMQDLERELGPDPEGWRWGELHAITWPHPLGATRPLHRIFNIGPFPLDGSGLTVAQASYSLREDGYAVLNHASLRMVVDLSDLDRVMVALGPGQSGQPFARHWGDLAERWLAGELVPLAFDREAIGPIEGVLSFRPR